MMFTFLIIFFLLFIFCLYLFLLFYFLFFICFFLVFIFFFFFFFSSRRRHTRWNCDWSSDVCSSDLRGKYVFDLATAVNAACFVEGGYVLERFESMMAGYESLRTLSLAE